MTMIRIRRKRLHEAQRLIYDSRRRFNVVCCGRRFGKTVLGIDLLIETALAAHKPAAWFSDKFASLDNPWRDLKRALSPVIVHKDEVMRRIDLVGGGSIKMWSLDDDPECSRGPAYARIVVDEAAKCKKLLHAWTQAIRANLTDYAGDAWFLSTPKGRNDFWELYRRGDHGDPTNLQARAEWMSWQMPTERNPHLPPEEIVALREEVGERAAAQEVDAQFLEYHGRYFNEWDESRHTCLVFDIPAWWNWFGGFDWGYDKPACFLLFAMDDAGRVVGTDEYYVTQKLDPDMAADIKGILAGRGLSPANVPIYADPSIWNQRKADNIGRARVEDFWAAGLSFVPANNDRLGGWSQMRQYLHGGLAPGETPKLRLFRGRCANLIRTIPLMLHDERPRYMHDLDTTLEDHAVDAARYALVSRVQPARDPDAKPRARELPPVVDRAPDYRPAWVRKKGKRFDL